MRRGLPGDCLHLRVARCHAGVLLHPRAVAAQHPDKPPWRPHSYQRLPHSGPGRCRLHPARSATSCQHTGLGTQEGDRAALWHSLSSPQSSRWAGTGQQKGFWLLEQGRPKNWNLLERCWRRVALSKSPGSSIGQAGPLPAQVTGGPPGGREVPSSVGGGAWLQPHEGCGCLGGGWLGLFLSLLRPCLGSHLSHTPLGPAGTAAARPTLCNLFVLRIVERGEARLLPPSRDPQTTLPSQGAC